MKRPKRPTPDPKLYEGQVYSLRGEHHHLTCGAYTRNRPPCAAPATHLLTVNRSAFGAIGLLPLCAKHRPSVTGTVPEHPCQVMVAGPGGKTFCRSETEGAFLIPITDGLQVAIAVCRAHREAHYSYIKSHPNKPAPRRRRDGSK